MCSPWDEQAASEAVDCEAHLFPALCQTLVCRGGRSSRPFLFPGCLLDETLFTCSRRPPNSRFSLLDNRHRPRPREYEDGPLSLNGVPTFPSGMTDDFPTSHEFFLSTLPLCVQEKTEGPPLRGATFFFPIRVNGRRPGRFPSLFSSLVSYALPPYLHEHSQVHPPFFESVCQGLRSTPQL